MAAEALSLSYSLARRFSAARSSSIPGLKAADLHSAIRKMWGPQTASNSFRNGEETRAA